MSLKLDKRIKDRDDIQSLIHYDKTMIGQTGYFALDLSCFSDVEKWCKYGELSDIADTDEDGNELDFSEDTIFISEDPEGFQYGWSFFIPESYLLPKEVQVRPFTSEEWKHKFEIGTVLKLREKETKDFSKLMYLGYDITSLGLEALIGNSFYSLEKLSEFYEYYDEESHKWVPFGVVM